jgi:hypothetical protein
MCANRSRQRTLYPWEETASPTISNKALFLSLLIDAKENCNVGIADVQGAYLNAAVIDFILMQIYGHAVKIFGTVNPEYREIRGLIYRQSSQIKHDQESHT